MDEQARGIVVRTRPLTETSLIVNWLSRECGRISTVAKGARRPRSAFSGKLDLYYEADFSFARSGRSTLHNLREVALRATRPDLRNDVERLTAAAKATRRLEKSTEEETPIPDLFELFKGFLDELAAGPWEPSLGVSFDAKLLAALGLDPALEGQGLNAGEARAFEQVRDLDWQSVRRVKLRPEQVAAMDVFVERQFRNAY